MGGATRSNTQEEEEEEEEEVVVVVVVVEKKKKEEEEEEVVVGKVLLQDVNDEWRPSQRCVSARVCKTCVKRVRNAGMVWE